MVFGGYKWFRYEKGQSLDCGDFTTHNSLKDAKEKMIELKELTGQYKSYYEAGKQLGVNAQQLKRLVDKGALYNSNGDVFIPSKTKLKL